MGISLKPEHLKRYRDIALLIAKYGRPGLLQQAGLDEVVVDGPPNGEMTKTGEALAADLELHISQRTPSFDEAGFTRAVADLVATQQNRTLEQIQVGKIVFAMLEVASRHGLFLVPELGMLGRALLKP